MIRKLFDKHFEDRLKKIITMENFFLSNYEEWKALTFLLETKNAFFENNIVNVYKIVYHDLL